MIGNDMRLDSGVGTCGKEGQSVPVGVGQPTLRIDGLTVGGTACFIFTFGSRSPADERRARKHPNPSLKTAAASQPGGFLLPLYTLINFPRSP
jgi:hypothetical protein